MNDLRCSPDMVQKAQVTDVPSNDCVLITIIEVQISE